MRKIILFRLIISLIVSSIAFGTLYVIAQQILRSDANDPQIQLAQDLASSLNGGASTTGLIAGRVVINHSLAPFEQIYDTQGNLVNGNAYLDNAQPTIPVGTLRASETLPYKPVTWQPASGVRIAAVAVRANNFYVVAGRNLSEVEKREDATLLLAALGWAATCIVVAFGWVLRFYGTEGWAKKQKRSK
jgi:hypothetical protein